MNPCAPACRESVTLRSSRLSFVRAEKEHGQRDDGRTIGSVCSSLPSQLSPKRHCHVVTFLLETRDEKRLRARQNSSPPSSCLMAGGRLKGKIKSPWRNRRRLPIQPGHWSGLPRGTASASRMSSGLFVAAQWHNVSANQT